MRIRGFYLNFASMWVLRGGLSSAVKIFLECGQWGSVCVLGFVLVFVVVSEPDGVRFGCGFMLFGVRSSAVSCCEKRTFWDVEGFAGKRILEEEGGLRLTSSSTGLRFCGGLWACCCEIFCAC
jgi:hypothetical protein